MQLVLNGRNMKISDRIHAYAEKRFGKLDKFFEDGPEARVELEFREEKNPKIEDRARVSAHLIWSDMSLRAEEHSPDIYASIDLTADKLARRLRREHEKRVQQRHGGKPAERRKIAEVVEPQLEPLSDNHNSDDPMEGRMADHTIHRQKQFNVGPMSAEEAANQMELVGHDFFVFLDEDTDTTSVLYRRSDGAFGLIEPALQEQRKGA